MMQTQAFLKVGWEGGGGGLALFLFNAFKVYHFYIQKLLNYFTFAKLCYAFEVILKRIHSKLSKNEPENIPQIKIT